MVSFYNNYEQSLYEENEETGLRFRPNDEADAIYWYIFYGDHMWHIQSFWIPTAEELKMYPSIRELGEDGKGMGVEANHPAVKEAELKFKAISAWFKEKDIIPPIPVDLIDEWEEIEMGYKQRVEDWSKLETAKIRSKFSGREISSSGFGMFSNKNERESNVEEKSKVDEPISNDNIRKEHIAEVELLHNTIKKLSRKNRFSLGTMTNSQLSELAYESRKKNGKINYAAIGRELGRHPTTIINEFKRRGLDTRNYQSKA